MAACSPLLVQVQNRTPRTSCLYVACVIPTHAVDPLRECIKVRPLRPVPSDEPEVANATPRHSLDCSRRRRWTFLACPSFRTFQFIWIAHGSERSQSFVGNSEIVPFSWKSPATMLIVVVNVSRFLPSASMIEKQK